MNDATLQYANQHADDDVRQLALRGCKDKNVDMVLALQQIRGRQSARRKLPSWAAIDWLLYPPQLNMEQCSSEATARYKAMLCQRLLAEAALPCPTLTDLTGGFGVDIAFMSAHFHQATYVERNTALAATAAHNLRLLGSNTSCVCADAEQFLAAMQPCTMIYADPARRDNSGARTYAIGDCVPDVLTLSQQLLTKGRYVLLKLSPMLDWRKAVADLGEQHVSEVHIVAVDGECKELLLLLTNQDCGQLRLCCANNDSCHWLTASDLSLPAAPPAAHITAGDCLYVPDATMMKAGCFTWIATRFGVAPMAHDSHLFVASQPVASFPGRAFTVTAVTTLNKRELRHTLAGLTRANIAVRNFPLSADQLRQRLRVADGGPDYLFGTTTADGRHVVIVCHRLT